MEGLKKNAVQNLRMPFITSISVIAVTPSKLLAASFTHKFIIGHREVESPNLGDAKEAQKMVEIMKDGRFDPREVLVLQSKKCATVQDVQHLVSVVLPHRFVMLT